MATKNPDHVNGHDGSIADQDTCDGWRSFPRGDPAHVATSRARGPLGEAPTMRDEDDCMAAEDLLIGMGIDPDRLTPVSKEEAVRLHWNPQSGDMVRMNDPSHPEDQPREFVSNGLIVEKGRVLRDTQQDRFMAIRAVDED